MNRTADPILETNGRRDDFHADRGAYSPQNGISPAGTNDPGAGDPTAGDLRPTEDISPTFDVGLIELLTELGRRKWLVAKTTGWAILVGAALCLTLPTRYTAVTRIMAPQQTPSAAGLLMNQLAGGGAGALTAIAGKQLGLKNPNDVYVGLLNSRPVADALLAEFHLPTLYRARDMTAARKILAENTAVATEKNGFISVAVSDKEKWRAAAMANAYTEQLRVLTKTLAVTEAAQRRLFYEEQLKLAREALVSAETIFQNVQQRKGLVQLDLQAKALIEGLAKLRAEVSAKQVEIDAERSYSTDRNPDMQLAELQLASLRDEVARLEQRNRSTEGTELQLGDVPGAGQEYLSAEHDLKYRQAILDLLMKQYDAARLDEAQDAAVIQVVEAAIEPDRPSAPLRVQTLSIATVAGFGFGCLLALGSWCGEIVRADPERAGQLRKMRQAFLWK